MPDNERESVFVTYNTRSGQTMRALVKKRHRDGSVTVEPYFLQDAAGKDQGVFQGGFTLRIAGDDIQTVLESHHSDLSVSKLAEIANGPQSKQKPRQPPKRHLMGMVGVAAVLMLSAASARAGDFPQQTQFLASGTVMTFGDKDYSVNGLEPCPHDLSSSCTALIPGKITSVYLYPVGSKTDVTRGVLTITGTNENPIISLSKLIYPDGLVKSFSPVLIGKISEGKKSND